MGFCNSHIFGGMLGRFNELSHQNALKQHQFHAVNMWLHCSGCCFLYDDNRLHPKGEAMSWEVHTSGCSSSTLQGTEFGTCFFFEARSWMRIRAFPVDILRSGVYLSKCKNETDSILPQSIFCP